MISFKNSAMPSQDLKPYPPGATSPMTAGIVTQNNHLGQFYLIYILPVY